MTDRYQDSRADWVERALKRELNDFQRRAVGLLCDAKGCGPYDFDSTFTKANWEYYGLGVSFVITYELATFDNDGLTRLVIGAHDQCIRVSIEGCGPWLMRVSMWQRHQRDGEMHKRHPTIEQAISRYRGES